MIMEQCVLSVYCISYMLFLFSWQILKTEAGTKRNETLKTLLHSKFAMQLVKENWFLLFSISNY